MRKMKKKMAVVIALMTVLCMTLTGCGAEMIPADQTVGALFELSAKENLTPMKDLLGFASEEDVLGVFFEEGADTELVDEFKSELEAAGVEMSDEDVQSFADSINAMISKITYTTEITSEEKDMVTVSLKVNGFSMDDMNQLLIDASEKMVDSLTEEDQLAIANGDADLFNAYMTQFMKDFMNGIATLEPSADTTEITVNCEKIALDVSGKEKVVWLPSDLQNFSDQVAAALFQ